MPDDLNEMFRRLAALQQARRRQQYQNWEEQMKLVDQLQRYGVCPCIAMGRYGTCCEGK
jgi:hypothetical protein